MGKGVAVIEKNGKKIAVINLMGRIYMDYMDCPFRTVDKILQTVRADYYFVDFHAEATSEKISMGWHLDGRVTAVFGTHTHVQTADARVLPGGTATLSDTGMCGADRSVLGREVESVLKKFTTGMPVRLPVVETGKIRVDGAAITYDHISGKASKIVSFSRFIEL